MTLASALSALVLAGDLGEVAAPPTGADASDLGLSLPKRVRGERAAGVVGALRTVSGLAAEGVAADASSVLRELSLARRFVLRPTCG